MSEFLAQTEIGVEPTLINVDGEADAILDPALLAFGVGIWILIVVVALWDVVWKAIAMWMAERNGAKGWYIALLIFNTAGILPIIYIYAIAKKTEVSKTDIPPSSTPQA